MAEINITEAKKWWVTPALVGIILVVAGVLMALYKRNALETIIMVTGILMIVGAVVSIALEVKETGHFPIFGVILVVFGLILALIPHFISNALMVLIAIALCLYGVLQIVGSLWADHKPTEKVIISVIIGVIALALGVYALLNLNTTADVVMIIIGAMIAVLGALQLYKAYRIFADYH